MAITIRSAAINDIPQIQAIYELAVLSGTASFELEPPDIRQMQQRYEALCAEDFPYLVAQEVDGTVLGYAYASFYRTRPAYRFTVEDSVYLSPQAQGKGLGTKLLQGIITACEAKNFRQMIGIVGDSQHKASIKLHKKLGFEVVGTFKNIGWKHETWLDTVLLQKTLGDGSAKKPT